MHCASSLFVASLRPDAQILRQPDFSGVHPWCRWEVEGGVANLHTPDLAHGRVLTDDFNPVEFDAAVNHERFRRQMTASLKSL